MPSKIEAKLVEAETDLAVMRCVLNFWKDPDTFSLSSTALATVGGVPAHSGATASSSHVPSSTAVLSLLPTGGENCLVHSMAERCFLECVRVQQQTSGNQNEPWRKRSTTLLKGIWTEFEKLPLTDFVPDFDVSMGQGVDEGKNGQDGVTAGSSVPSKEASNTTAAANDKDKGSDKGPQGQGLVFSMHTLLEV